MCGIAGIVSPLRSDKHAVERMICALSHRGPDSSGIWSNSTHQVILGHARLSILDLSISGHQPMSSEDTRFTITFNGEIYNYKQLARELASHNLRLRGRSDTEVLIESISLWGLQGTLERLNGMFAFALYDNFTQTIFLVRDRFGEKPLYYSSVDNHLVFSSQLSSLSTHPLVDRTISLEAHSLYTQLSYIPEPYTIYCNSYKLPPGHILTYSLASNRILSCTPYWEPQVSAFNPPEPQNESLHILHDLLSKSVSQRLVSDVPLGSFLSGGIDSSLVTALAQHQLQHPIHTYSIGFPDISYDESPYASAVASHLQTNHTTFSLSDSDILSAIPLLPQIWDEPFADSSQIPAYLLSRLASRDITVALTGDGADEIFCGYNRYNSAYTIYRSCKAIPLFLRRLLSSFLALPSESFLLYLNLPFGRARALGLYNKIQKLSSSLLCKSDLDYYKSLVSFGFSKPQSVTTYSRACSIDNSIHSYLADQLDFVDYMMIADIVSYLPGDILVKVDRAAMANSIETRAPFLDHTLYEFAQSTSLSFKQKDGVGKSCLRQVLSHYLPTQLFDRPKHGFGVPIDRLLRSALRSWAEDLLSPSMLALHGLYDASTVNNLLEEHISTRRNNHHSLWNIVMFQSWYLAHK